MKKFHSIFFFVSIGDQVLEMLLLLFQFFKVKQQIFINDEFELSQSFKNRSASRLWWTVSGPLSFKKFKIFTNHFYDLKLINIVVQV